MKDQLEAKSNSTTNELNVDFGGFGESSDLKIEGTQKTRSVLTSSDIHSLGTTSLPTAKGNIKKIGGEQFLNYQLEKNVKGCFVSLLVYLLYCKFALYLTLLQYMAILYWNLHNLLSWLQKNRIVSK